MNFQAILEQDLEDLLTTYSKVITPINLARNDNPSYKAPYHIDKLNEYLVKVANGEINRLAVFMPPRHGKSELISKYFPAWYLGNNPECRIILTSYEADFAATWSHKVRDLIKEYGHLFPTPIQVDEGSAARNRWDIQGYTGGMVSAGVGGAITGKGAKILIIDDPVKNAETANSVTYREKAKDWFRSTAYTRLEPDGAVILIQTRWHEDDLGGWLLNESKEDWTIINFPAINTDGEALWPERFPLQRLNEIRGEIGEYWFSALYQQSPQPPEGGILKRQWIQYYDPKDPKLKLVLNDCNIYTGWDLAISEKETADFTCSCTLKHSNVDNNLYIVDWTRDHITFPEQQQMVIQQQNKHNSALIGIEDVAYQAALPQSLKNQLLPIKGIKRFKDKVTRITSSFTLFEQGLVHLPINHPLLNEFESEYVYFPTGLHDDLLDATEIALELARLGNNPYNAPTDAYYKFSKHGLQQNRRRRMYR